MADSKDKLGTARRRDENSRDLELVLQTATKAGEIALSYFEGKNRVWKKSGNSPVSEADFAVDKFLRETLLNARPDYGWLSEETDDDLKRLEKQTVFVVDPIDGTRGFLAGGLQWCISISVIHKGNPVLGVLECPALSETYHAVEGQGSYLNDNSLLLKKSGNIRSITGSRKLNALLQEKYSDRFDIMEFVPSLAYRLAMVANEKVDAGVARPGSHDWDLAAADMLLREAGGMMSDLRGRPRTYNKSQTVSGSLVAAGPGRHELLLELANSDGFLQ